MSDSSHELVANFIKSVPEGQNPFTLAAQSIGEINFPPVPSYTYDVIIFFMVVHGIVMLGALFLILFPLFSGPEARKKHLWLWHKCYIGSTDTTPFYIPNNGIAVAVCQFWTNAFFLIFLLLSYLSFKSIEFARACYVFIWLDMALLSGFVGFWLTGVTSLFTCLCSPHRDFERPKRSMRLLRICSSPSFLNVFCILVPLSLVLKTFYRITFQVVAMTHAKKTHREVLRLFNKASGEWLSSSLARASSQTILLLETAVQHDVQDSHLIVSNSRWAVLEWNIAWFIVLMFYFFNTIALLKLLRRSLRIALGKSSLLEGKEKLEKHNQSGTTGTMSTNSNNPNLVTSDRKSLAAARLRKSYLHLTFQCLFLSLCLLLDLSTGIFFTTHTRLTTKEGRIRALTVWLNRLGSVFMAFATLLQSWRVCNTQETNKTPSDYTLIMVSDQPSEKPRLVRTVSNRSAENNINLSNAERNGHLPEGTSDTTHLPATV
ncbi:hypothetical protein CROQUDRAFT_725086 [Cronartium quercuum f. sp. fusiforme G11]|uniref:Uncharacterized protein n=1 Tax=Cronartium quercuum f. sp. fusiforme G11 TaxID=708437 RepID=A0A9P6N9I3_9BASI|nr:hypothetical protein CROQUDRAFT_725086 [Cronartium quercuum f. sp. fusiforme G11]